MPKGFRTQTLVTSQKYPFLHCV